MRRALFLGLTAAAVCLTVAPSTAHPFGQKPVAFLARSATGVELSWVVAPDDVNALIAHLRLGPVAPAAAARDPRFRRYVLDRIAIEHDGARCPGEVLGMTVVSTGFAVGARFDCGERVDAVTVTVTLLLDISADYVTLVHASTDGDPVRDAFTAAAPSLRIDFVRVAARPDPSATPVAEGGRSGRIIAAIRGLEGAGGLFAALGLAFVLGLLHGMTPGHGKTIAAAYLVGAGGTVRQSLALGGVVAGTHALSTALIAAVPIALGHQQPPRGLSGWLELTAGLLILGLGFVLWRRPPGSGHDHDHARAAMPLRRLAGIGLVGGLVPNPEALVVVLVAFSLHRWTAGVALVVAFSFGLAAVVLAVALAAVRGRGLIVRVAGGRLAALAPRIAAAIFAVMGVVVAARGALRI